MHIAIIVPVAQQDLFAVFTQLDHQLQKCRLLWPEVSATTWLIDDGVNADASTQLEQLVVQTPHLHCLHLSRHFGYHGAVQAGLAGIQADAYIALDPHYQAQFAQLPKLFDALIVGRFAVIGFDCGKFDSFHDFAATAPARRALLQVWARNGFSLDDLAKVGFKQKRLAWLGPLPPAPRLPRWLVALAMALVVMFSWTPPLSMVLNILLAAALITQLRFERHTRVPYVVASIE